MVVDFREKKWRPLIIVYILAAIIMWLNADQIVGIMESILPSIQQGADTVGIRYSLWNAGLKMWQDHVIGGVGIGMYPSLLQYYALDLPSHYWNLTAHNTYILVLAETGIVGFILFVGMMVVSFRNFITYKSEEIAKVSLRNTWLITFIVYAIGAATMSAQYDKLLWFLMGASVCFQVTSSKKVIKVKSKSNNKVDSISQSRATAEG